MAKANEVLNPKYRVWVWCLEDGGHWGRARWYATHEMAQAQVDYWESQGVAATIEAEYG